MARVDASSRVRQFTCETHVPLEAYDSCRPESLTHSLACASCLYFTTHAGPSHSLSHSLTHSLACASCLYFSSWAVLGFVDVGDRGFQVVFVVYPTAASAFGPKALTAGMPRLDRSCAPRFELITNGLGIVSGRGDHDVNVIRAGADGVELPRAEFTVICDGLFNEFAIQLRECKRRFFISAAAISRKSSFDG